MQIGNKVKYFLEDGCETMFHWPDKSQKYYLVRVKYKGEDYSWSGGFEINEISLFDLKCKIKSKSDQFENHYCRITVKSSTEECTTVVYFLPADEKFPNYMIRNKSKLQLVVHQLHIKRDKEIVNAGESKPYAWAEPSPKNKRVVVGIVGAQSTLHNQEELSYCLDEVDLNLERIIFLDSNNKKRFLQPRLLMEGVTKVLEIQQVGIKYEKPSKENENQSKNKLQISLSINVPSLGVSLMSSLPQEIMNLYMTQIKFLWEKGIPNNTILLSIKNMQIDNMIMGFKNHFFFFYIFQYLYLFFLFKELHSQSFFILCFHLKIKKLCFSIWRSTKIWSTDLFHFITDCKFICKRWSSK